MDRSNGSALVHSLIEQMKREEVFKLAIAPEGTRKPVKRWKAGALKIAAEAGVPVYAGYFDWRTRRISCGEKLPLSGDISTDLAMVQEYYEGLHLTGRHKEKYITH